MMAVTGMAAVWLMMVAVAEFGRKPGPSISVIDESGGVPQPWRLEDCIVDGSAPSLVLMGMLALMLPVTVDDVTGW